MKLPTLYKKTSTGAIQQWDISVTEGYDYNEVSESVKTLVPHISMFLLGFYFSKR